MVNINFSKKPFFKTIFLSAIIITIPFLEFIKVNFFQIDYVIYSQIILYYLTVIILFFLLSLALSYILKDIFKIYNLVFTSAFSFWLIFKFDYLKSNFSFLREIYGRNFIIFEIIIAFVFIFLIIILFYILLNKSKANNLFNKFISFFFIFQFLFVTIFICSLAIKDKINKKDIISINSSDNFFSITELENIQNNKIKRNIYFIIMDGMTSLSEYKKILSMNKKSSKEIEEKISQLVKFYTDSNFNYIKNSFSTFKDTHHTIGSMLNMYPLQLQNMNKNSFLYQNNLYPASLGKNNFEINKFPMLIKTLKEINYDFKWLGYKLNCKFVNPNLCYDYKEINSRDKKLFKINFYILKSFLASTPALDVYKILNKNLNLKIQLPDRKKIIDDNIYNSSFEVISEFIENSKKFQKENQPYFYLIHNILPKLDDHFFEKNCEKKNIDFNESSNNFYLYRDNYECALKKINEIIKYINEFDANAIVIIQGDQGHKFSKKDSIDNYKIFNLVKVPEFCKDYLTNEIDNVNGIRLSVSCATNSEVKLLKRKLYVEGKFSN